ncbi:adenylosuccinate synthetase [Accumulibacter sp.]|uniref:adenylosuccinate synthetase n=1 Tax=Accumulibacter sp. TaxID=2053492 RepID=UPI0025E70215|nr:adenylosuccinate synthetase [Accumulibacter sp.]MCM8596006.1 adenylosuccinate synthetase [Accumulibacter sp.]MCM8626656.1 adenylosuccinate synthetase [Accumulibacter sp.]MDS4050155.1 adenylosuccinate synthetase [Accumulibacter sp.]
MPASRLVSVLGLAFGDCGKGLFTDALCRRWPVHSVVRFNGGAQAGHNVVLPDGCHHTFAQFGSGTLVRGVATVLAHPVVVHPTALLVENERLGAKGIDDALARLTIDARCPVNTAFHQAAGRLREIARGARAHGTCGVGVGETVRHRLGHPDEALSYGELTSPARALRKLEAIRLRLRDEFSGFGREWAETPTARRERALLADQRVAETWLAACTPLLREVPPASPEQIAARLDRPGAVLFEGAQGVLLDEDHGFHPHTTWSSIGTPAVDAVARDYGLSGEIEHLGVLRAYLTRHGPGPMPTADPALDVLREPHNSAHGWQGAFRRGHPDAVLLDYAVSVVGRLDGLLVSHLDAVERVRCLRWCAAYELPRRPGDGQLCVRNPARRERVERLRPGSAGALDRQARLTALLSRATPAYEPERITGAGELIERLEAVAGCRVRFVSAGPSHRSVSAR